MIMMRLPTKTLLLTNLVRENKRYDFLKNKNLRIITVKLVQDEDGQGSSRVRNGGLIWQLEE